LRLGCLGNITAHSHSFAACAGDGRDNRFGAGFTGCIIYNDGRAFRGERLGDGGSNAFGCAGNYCDLTF